MGKKFLYLVRHGQYQFGDEAPSKLRGHLTPLGRKQSRLTARRVSPLPISVIHHSTLSRAIETAQIIATRFPGVPLRASALLCECIPSIPADRVDEFADVSLAEVERDALQADKAFERYFRPTRGAERREIIVCHGNIIRYFVCRALSVSPDAWMNTDISNCGITEVLVKPSGRIMLLSHNDTGHLPYEMRTFF